VLDQPNPAGATPAADGAKPSQSEPAKPATGTPTAAATVPAKGDDDALGEPGKRALQAERDARQRAEDRAKAAERERDELKAQTQTDAEKAVTEAKAAGKTEVLSRLQTVVRRSAVEKALMQAGATPSLIDDLAGAREFAALKVNDDDEIDPKELADAVKAHKARVPDAYKAAQPAPGATGSSDAGARGGGQEPAKTLTDAIERHYNPQA
jgi:hypothetical protein